MEKKYKEIEEQTRQLKVLRKSKELLYTGAYKDGWENCKFAERKRTANSLKNFFFCFDATPNDDKFYTIKTERVKELLKSFSHSTPKNVEKGKGFKKRFVPHTSSKPSPPLKIRHKLVEVFPYGKVYVPIIPKKKDKEKK